MSPRTDDTRDEQGSTRRRFLAGAVAAGGAASVLSATGGDAVVSGASASETAAERWKMFAADRQNTGRNGAAAPRSGVEVDWQRPLGAFTEATFDRLTTYVGTEGGASTR